MQLVALFTRAWIEIPFSVAKIGKDFVALFTRAWIEITAFCLDNANYRVALFTRAWIEIGRLAFNSRTPTRRPLHEGVD